VFHGILKANAYFSTAAPLVTLIELPDTIVVYVSVMDNIDHLGRSLDLATCKSPPAASSVHVTRHLSTRTR
jgi:hypothetical protein